MKWIIEIAVFFIQFAFFAVGYWLIVSGGRIKYLFDYCESLPPQKCGYSDGSLVLVLVSLVLAAVTHCFVVRRHL